jgi:hypothetical protein
MSMSCSRDSAPVASVTAGLESVEAYAAAPAAGWDDA